jgi:hypothetical protein
LTNVALVTFLLQIFVESWRRKDYEKISRRHFLASSATGAAAITLSGSLPPFSQANAANFEYNSPTPMPFSQEREKANQTIARAPKARGVLVNPEIVW